MEQIRLAMELLYYTCAPVLVVIGLIGLQQLRISKEARRISARRESLSLAADRCAHYTNYIIPLLNRLDTAMDEKGVKNFEKFDWSVEGDSIKVRPRCSREEFVRELSNIKLVVSEYCAAMNAMDAFAVFFTSAVADEQVAFSSIGITFCHSVRQFLPHLVLIPPEVNYNNIIKLFMLWNARLEVQKLCQEKKDIESQIEKIPNRFIRPVGTE